MDPGGNDPVLVTGATGRVGRRVVDALVEAGAPVRALTRRPEQAALPDAVQLVAGDFAVPHSLDVALRGVSTVFLVWTLPFATAPDVVQRLARSTQRVVLLSSPHRTPHPFFSQPNPAATLHAGLERLIADSGLVTTTIRPGMFASNAIHWWSDPIRRGDAVRWPYAAAETAPIDERDVAAVAAAALLDDKHAGGDYVLTGPESLSQAEQVRSIGTAVGRDVEFEELSPEQFRRLAAETWPAPALDMLLAAWAATMGVPALVTSTVADVTGVPARTFAHWASEHAAAFR